MFDASTGKFFFKLLRKTLACIYSRVLTTGASATEMPRAESRAAALRALAVLLLIGLQLQLLRRVCVRRAAEQHVACDEHGKDEHAERCNALPNGVHEELQPLDVARHLKDASDADKPQNPKHCGASAVVRFLGVHHVGDLLLDLDALNSVTIVIRCGQPPLQHRVLLGVGARVGSG